MFDATTIDACLAIFGLYWAVTGVMMLITGKVYGHGRDIAEKNTPESIRAAAPFLGIGNIAVGLAMVVPKLCGWLDFLAFLKAYDWYILLGGAAVGVAFVIMGYRKLAEK